MTSALKAPASELCGVETGDLDDAERARLAALAEALGRPIRVLAPCEAGRGAFWLGQQAWIAEVHAADARPWALHLLALRLAAFAAHGPEAAAFLQGAPDWRARWEAVRPALRPDARLWWDARPAQLAWGLDRLIGGAWAPEERPCAEVELYASPFETVLAVAPERWDAAVGAPFGRRPLALVPKDGWHAPGSGL